MKNEFQNKNSIFLNDNHIEILKNLALNSNFNPSKNPELFCQESKELSKSLPESIKHILNNFLKNGNENGFLLIKNFPINNEELEKTPHCNKLHIGETTILARIQSILINYIGDMIAYEAEGDGHLFQDIIPDIRMENIQTSVGSNTELEVHVEQAFSKLKPDILSLGCLRGDENAFTYILPVGRILENLTNDEIEMLYKPLWMTSVDFSFKLNELSSLIICVWVISAVSLSVGIFVLPFE